MATSGLLTIGVKCAPPMPPWFEMVKGAAFQFLGRHLALARFLGQFLQFLATARAGSSYPRRE